MDKLHATIGIDYSITSPSICAYLSEMGPFRFENCCFYFLSDHKRRVENSKSLPNLFGTLHAAHSSPEERFCNISSWAIDSLEKFQVHSVAIEDYAFAAKGRVFHIGENTGQLKYQLWCKKLPFVLVAPTEVKKFATGKGNADKEALAMRFVEETGVDLPAVIGTKGIKDNNPTSDIIDSYFLAKWLHHKENQAK